MSNEFPIGKVLAGRKVTRRELVQDLLSGIAAGILFPGLSPLHPVYEHLLNEKMLDSADEALAAANHKPVFLSESQFLSLEKIAEIIVPRSGEAQSTSFIDLLLSVDSVESQRGFAASLGAFETAADQKFHKKIAGLSEGQLNELLQAASIRDSGDYAHFENLKGWAVGAYYSSEIGMRELGWTPDRVFAAFPGCTQAGSHS